MDNNNNFSYSYSARDAEEAKKIREKYISPEKDDMADKMERLRRLDRGVHSKASAVSLVVGIVSCLLLGLGMSAVMEFSAAWLVPGIAIGTVGIVGVALSYPIYLRVLKKERERITPEILKLTDEILK